MTSKTCEICGNKENLVVLPTPKGSEHTLCMECAGRVATEALRWMD